MLAQFMILLIYMILNWLPQDINGIFYVRKVWSILQTLKFMKVHMNFLLKKNEEMKIKEAYLLEQEIPTRNWYYSRKLR